MYELTPDSAYTKARGTVPCNTTDDSGIQELEVMITAISTQPETVIIGSRGRYFGLTKDDALALAAMITASTDLIPETPEDIKKEYGKWYETHIAGTDRDCPERGEVNRKIRDKIDHLIKGA